MDALALAGLLTAITVLVSLIVWLPLASRTRVRRTEVYLSGESQSDFSLGFIETSWAVRRVFERLYSMLLNYVQTGIFDDWFALSLPYLLLLLVLLIVAVLTGGGV